MVTRPHRYSSVAIGLHWAIALSILSMIPMGLWMSSAIEDPARQALAYRVFQIHKSVGFLILALTVIRIVWRLTHPVPALPAQMKSWEGFAARATHVSFYGLMLALPLTGWAYVSTGWAVAQDHPLAVATNWFGLFQIPHLAFIELASERVRRSLAFATMGAHSWMAWGAVILVVLHVGAALKHQFINRDGVLAHMVPVLKSEEVAPAAEPSTLTKWAERLVGLGLIASLAMAGAVAATPSAYQVSDSTASNTAEVLTDQAVQPGTATAWIIDRLQSSIVFSGTHSGASFVGQFADWQGQVWFDPENLEGSRAYVTLSTASAKTGDATKDGSLGGAEWFDPAKYPTARFEATEFTHVAGNRYEARGTLRIKTVSLPVVLPFTYDRQDNQASVEGQVELDRTKFDLGKVSDAAGNWVSKAVNVTVSVKATAEG